MTSRPPEGRQGLLLRVGRYFGVPIYFAPSWLLAAGLLTVYYAPLVRHLIPGTTTGRAYAVTFTFAVLFALCVLAHELGHTSVSLLLGHPVRRVVIFLLGGVSEITREPQRARDELFVAAAGPLVSLIIGAGCGGAFLAVEPHTTASVLLGLLAWSNLIVAVFNLLPGLPLDGGRIVRAAVWAVTRSQRNGTRIAAWGGRGVAVLVAVAGVVLNRESWGIAVGFFTFLTAAYLWLGASHALRSAEMLERLPEVQLDDLLRPGLFVPDSVSVAEALRRAWTANARGLVVTAAADQPQAIVDEARISAVPPERRPWTTVTEVARPLEHGLILPRGLGGEALLAAVRETPATEYLVVNADGSPAGILASADLVTALQAAAKPA